MAYIRKQITMPPLVAEMLKGVAAKEGETESSIIADAIKDYARRWYPEVEQEARKVLAEKGVNDD